MSQKLIFAAGLWACLACLPGCGDSSNPPEAAQTPGALADEPLRTIDEAAVEAAALTLQLRPGDQFPLRKVVEQELRQSTQSGPPRVDRSRLEVLFAITVQSRVESRTQLSVRYDRVKYVHDIADEHLEFDSTQPSVRIPVSVRPYLDMVGDGFSFWIGADNQIAEVVGLREFIGRALRNVPPQDWQAVSLGIEAGSGETGIANFVDNTIGLLPFGKPAAPGDTWSRAQHLSVPVPMTANNTYVLKEITPEVAVVDVLGDIVPSTIVNSVRNEKGVQLIVDGGHTRGSCTIFRDTGLPRDSHVDRTVEMTVVMPDASRFRQVKRVVTVVESFPAIRHEPLYLDGVQNSIQQVQALEPAR